MTEIVCPGWRASWVNAWLAAVGATVLDERIRLHWTTDAEPVAVLSSEQADPVAALVESWPDAESLANVPIARHWQEATELKRNVPVKVFRERAGAVRNRTHAWTLSSTMTDLAVDEDGNVAHGPFDPHVPKGLTLHDRLVRVHRHVKSPLTRIQGSLAGGADREKDNGLGFDQTRLGSLSDASDKWVDPVVEVLAFFGLALLPARGRGDDKKLNRSADAAAQQRGWRQVSGSSEPPAFFWPAWSQPLDCDGIDALLDQWNPGNKTAWARFCVQGGWRSVRYRPRGDERTVAFGAVRL